MDLAKITHAIARKEMSLKNNFDDLYLQHGQIGSAIFFYWCGEKYHKNEYIEYADFLLDNIQKKMNAKSYIDIPNGILGLGIGFDVLIKKRYVGGKSDEILEGLDEHVYRFVNSKIYNLEKKFEKEHIVLLLNTLLYFTYRLDSGIENDMDRKIYQMFSYDILNIVYQNIPDSFFKEPLPFSFDFKVLQLLWATYKLHKLGLFTSRIEKIWDEIKYDVFSINPFLHGNRLSLFYISAIIGNVLDEDNSWKKYSEKLKQDISLEYIIDVELMNRNVFFTDGIGGIALLLCACERHDLGITYDRQKIASKIVKSEVWNLLDSESTIYKEHAGLDGFCGLALLLNKFNKNGKN